MSNSDDGISRKAEIVKLLKHIEKSWEASSPPEYEKSVSEESQRSTRRENENQQKAGVGVIQEITDKDNSSDLSEPTQHHHDHKATQCWSSSGEQADDEESAGPDSIEDSNSRFSDDKKEERNLKKLSSSDGETQPSPKSSRSSSSSAGSRSEEEQQFVVPENDFVVTIDDRYTVLPRVGTSFRGRFTTSGYGSMPPPWSRMEQQHRQNEASRHFDQPESDNVQHDDSARSRRRKREGEKS